VHEEFIDLCCWPNVREVKSITIIWVEHVARMGEAESVTGFGSET
jgi:hypothetical protein